MSFYKQSVLAICLCSGAAVSVAVADETPVTLEASSGPVTEVGHIYFNIATGERVITLMGDGQTQGVDSGSPAVWSSLVRNQCADAGYTTEWFFIIDQGNDCYSVGCGDATLLDFGDIELDTVVDCVHLSWVSEHDDVDADSDGIGDGVVGLAGQWIWWDADNGRAVDISTRMPLVSLTLFDLPGNIMGEGNFSRYSIDVDLEGAGSGSSLVFEIGDSDGDPQRAMFHNSGIANMDNNKDGNLDSDLDGDGLFDWAWSVRFYQPGNDSDGDGIPDGEWEDGLAEIGIGFGAPDGVAIDNDDGTWSWEVDPSSPNAGQEDAFAMYAAPFNGEILHAGFFWFGGFECSSEPLPDGPGYTPSALFEHAMYGGTLPDPCENPADFDGNEVLNFFDVAAFLGFYADEDPRADFAADGKFNFTDVAVFLGFFSEGCP